MPDLKVTGPNTLTFNGKTYRCAIGENGVTRDHKEGGKATPIGSFALRECWYRADRILVPKTTLPLREITRLDGWCDEPRHPEYNRHVTLPFTSSHETLWREDHRYDIVVPMGFNDAPIVPGKGSAIFLHLAAANYWPTFGCVAVNQGDMQEILAAVNKTTRIIIATF